MIYRIAYVEQVVKNDIPKIAKKDRDAISSAIERKLTTKPDVYGKPLRHSLKNHWSLRVGRYRVIYRIDNKVIRILFIGYREKVYIDAAKRIFSF